MIDRDASVIALIESGDCWTLEKLGPVEYEILDKDVRIAYSTEPTGARIAACAPELARWFVISQSCCSCLTPSTLSHARHRDGCEWLALAKKLGVR